jgi:hypothetical protein
VAFDDRVFAQVLEGAGHEGLKFGGDCHGTVMPGH